MAYKTTDAFAAQFFDDNGAPAEGHTLTFLVTGTSTPASIAFDTAGSSTATTVTIGANGFPQNSGSDVEIYFNEATTYDIVRKDSGGTAYGPTVTAFSVTASSTGLTALGVLSAAGSAANAIVADLTSPPSALSDQTQVIVELQHGANTSTSVTFNLNSLGAKSVKRANNAALVVGDTGGIGAKLYLSYSATNDVWILLNPAITSSTYIPDNNVTAAKIIDQAITASKFGYVPLNLKSGLAITNDGTTPDEIIGIATGEIGDTTQSYLMQLGSAFTKRIATSGSAATFAVGTGLGGLSDDDSLTADTWYGVFLLSKSTDVTDCDIIFATTKAKSLSDAVATAAGFDISRLIGYVLTDATSDIIPFFDDGENSYLWDVMVDASPSASATRALVTSQCPPFQIARLQYSMAVATGGAATYGVLTQTGQTDTAPTSSYFHVAKDVQTGGGLTQSVSNINMKVSSASQVYHRESTTTNVTPYLFTQGYNIDYKITDLV